MTWRPPPLVFPDIELLLTTYLRTRLDARPDPYAAGVVVSRATPNPLPVRLVTVRRDGGAGAPTRDQPRVGINVWAATERDAADLSALVRALLRDLPDGAPVLAVPAISGPSAIADPSGKPCRYLTAEIHTRGIQL